MHARSIRRFMPLWMGVIASLAAVTVSMAGGFYLEVAVPEAKEAEGAVLMVKPYGCHNPSDAEITATAEGVVRGQRQTIKLDLAQRTRGVHAIRQQWPEEGSWVIAITGKYMGATRSALVTLDRDGRVPTKEKLQVRMVPRPLNAQDISAALNSAERVAKN